MVSGSWGSVQESSPRTVPRPMRPAAVSNDSTEIDSRSSFIFILVALLAEDVDARVRVIGHPSLAGCKDVVRRSPDRGALRRRRPRLTAGRGLCWPVPWEVS